MTLFLTVFLVLYVWHAMGITIGYHRLLSHRSFSCPKFVEYFWVLAGYLVWQGSPIWWATIHRTHHKFTDTALDPHSPDFGWFNAQYGWLLREKYADHVSPALQSKDLLKDPVYRFLEQDGNLHRGHAIGFATCVLFRLIILACFGWVPVLASIAAWVAVWQIPLMLNVVCHIQRLGYRTYATDEGSVNVWWVGILAMGEGWHNNHHASPGSARTGIQPHEFDASWLVIRLMRKLGLVTRINEATHEQLSQKYRVVSVSQTDFAITDAAVTEFGATATGAIEVDVAEAAATTTGAEQSAPSVDPSGSIAVASTPLPNHRANVSLAKKEFSKAS